MRRNTQAFTLVELLVVIAIIGILATAVGAGLARAKSAAKSTICISNLKQFGMSSQMYWDDNAQRAFPYLKSTDMDGAVYWFGWLGRGEEGARALDRSKGALWTYLGGSGLELCPSFRYQDPLYKPKALSASFGYGYNLHLTQPKSGAFRFDGRGRLISEIASPSSVILFADSAQINDFQAPASRDHPLIEEFYYVNHGPSVYANGHFRHTRQAMTVFCDGHVSSEKPEHGTTDTRLPDANIARFRAEILIPR